MKFENILFDMDGTILNTEIFYFKMFSYTATLFNIHLIDEQYREYYSMDIYKKAEKLIKDYNCDFTADEFVAEYRKTQDIMIPKADKSLLFKDTEDTLNRLKKHGAKIYLCSNSRIFHIEKMLKITGLSEMFDGITSRDILNLHKPDPEFYIKSVEKFGLDKENCCAVEDSNSGIYSAHGAGLFTIGLKREFNLDNRMYDKLFYSLAQVADYLIENK